MEQRLLQLGELGLDSCEQLRETLCMLPQMWTQDSFRWDSPNLVIPERNVVPKPLQKPHPPLWVACSNRGTILEANLSNYFSK